jgi:hypothetical protein
MLARMAPRSVCHVITTPMTKPMDAHEAENDGEKPSDIIFARVGRREFILGPRTILPVGHGVHLVAHAHDVLLGRDMF